MSQFAQDLCDQFVANFQGSYARPKVEDDLYQVRQRQGEPLQDFNRCFTERRNIILRITSESVVIAFKRGVRDQKMVEKLATKEIRSTTELFEFADKCAQAIEARDRQIDGQVTTELRLARLLQMGQTEGEKEEQTQ